MALEEATDHLVMRIEPCATQLGQAARLQLVVDHASQSLRLAEHHMCGVNPSDVVC